MTEQSQNELTQPRRAGLGCGLWPGLEETSTFEGDARSCPPLLDRTCGRFRPATLEARELEHCELPSLHQATSLELRTNRLGSAGIQIDAHDIEGSVLERTVGGAKSDPGHTPQPQDAIVAYLILIHRIRESQCAMSARGFAFVGLDMDQLDAERTYFRKGTPGCDHDRGGRKWGADRAKKVQEISSAARKP